MPTGATKKYILQVDHWLQEVSVIARFVPMPNTDSGETKGETQRQNRTKRSRQLMSSRWQYLVVSYSIWPVCKSVPGEACDSCPPWLCCSCWLEGVVRSFFSLFARNYTRWPDGADLLLLESLTQEVSPKTRHTAHADTHRHTHTYAFHTQCARDVPTYDAHNLHT